jgi:cytochrome c
MSIGHDPVEGSAKLSTGERTFQKCYSCHALEAGQNVSGPSLYRVVGRTVAAEPGFRYSIAMRRFAAANPAWTKDLLDRFIADPEAVVPGTTMSFVGIRDPQERAALIAYLGSQEPR